MCVFSVYYSTLQQHYIINDKGVERFKNKLKSYEIFNLNTLIPFHLVPVSYQYKCV